MKVIVTLPSPDKKNSAELIEDMFSHPLVVGARWNSAIRSSLPPLETLGWAKEAADRYGKKLWVDIKGRQLRIAEWAVPTYSDIVLNRSISVRTPADIFFRGTEDRARIIKSVGNRIWLDADPRHALGAGQAVNIISDDLVINGDYLSGMDLEYIEAAAILRIKNFMLSFVEKTEDIEETKDAITAFSPFRYDTELWLKIESRKGLAFVDSFRKEAPHPLVLARDDMLSHIGVNRSGMIHAAEEIINAYPAAIAASQFFLGLEYMKEVTASDISDIRLMALMGYRTIMLSDGISHHHFSSAIKALEDYNDIFGREECL